MLEKVTEAPEPPLPQKTTTEQKEQIQYQFERREWRSGLTYHLQDFDRLALLASQSVKEYRETRDWATATEIVELYIQRIYWND